MIRLLITGSRTWDDRAAIANELALVVRHLGGTTRSAVTLVSGACPRGADRIAEQIAEEWGWTVERHAADWDQHHRAAGFIRNTEMVALGADACLCFRRGGTASKGTTHCGKAAERAGIPTTWIEAASP